MNNCVNSRSNIAANVTLTVQDRQIGNGAIDGRENCAMPDKMKLILNNLRNVGA